MTENKKVDPVIVDICERIIEDAQTTLMFQRKPSNRVTLNLATYMGPNDDIRRLKKPIIAFLKEQEIRVYEDEISESGEIVGSREAFVKIFDEVILNESINFHIFINLIYSQYMMNLLVD